MTQLRNNIIVLFWRYSCLMWLQRYSRGDLGLHEDEDENQQGGQTAGKHHPDGEFTVTAQRTDDPAAFLGTRHRETAGNTQFLERRQRHNWVWEENSSVLYVTVNKRPKEKH